MAISEYLQKVTTEQLVYELEVTSTSERQASRERVSLNDYVKTTLPGIEGFIYRLAETLAQEGASRERIIGTMLGARSLAAAMGRAAETHDLAQIELAEEI